MKYYSTKNPSSRVSLKEALIRGLAEDGGLFMPERIMPMSQAWFQKSPASLKEIAFDVSQHLLGDDIPKNTLHDLVDRAINFDVPVVPVEDGIWSVELYHGPTLAFKDFGARFLAGLMEHYASSESREIIVLAATSGDTGSAVASGFYNRKGIKVVVLYPSGKVSPLQEKQLTTVGGNITAWEVDGTFDDCQRLVKQMFMDKELNDQYLLTSANSINIGRLLPQTFYYFYAWSQMPKGSVPVFSVPSGNFGNLTAGVIAKRLGLPVGRFIASTNVNDVVPTYLEGGPFKPRPSAATISNAMDVGDPSNFSRLLDLYQNDRASMSRDIVGYSYSDDETSKAMADMHRVKGYLMDPHGAVAYLGLKKFLKETSKQSPGLFLETAHPAKFLDVVESATSTKVKLPESLEIVRNKEKHSVKVSSKFSEVRERLSEV